MHPQRNLIEAAMDCVINEIALPSKPGGGAKKPYDMEAHNRQENVIYNSMTEMHGSGWHGNEEHWKAYENAAKTVNPMGHHASRAAVTMSKNVLRLMDKNEKGMGAEASKIAHSLHTDKPYYGSLDPKWHGVVDGLHHQTQFLHFKAYQKTIKEHPVLSKHYGDAAHHEDQFKSHMKEHAGHLLNYRHEE
tara:strand:+ start:103 stop:672 length:570 start_codon:yes stop_codon:yes gene_type:complete